MRHKAISCPFIILLLLGLLVLTGCGSPDREPAGGSDAPCIELVDAAGQTVAFGELPRRIVVVGRGPHMVLHLLYMFPEAGERLVGMEKKGGTVSDFLPLVDPALEEKVVLETNPNAEQIAALEPDVVIMKNTMVDQLGKTLAEIGIPVVYVNLETPELFFKDLDNLGMLLGNEERAREIRNFYSSRLQRFQEVAGSLSEEDKPRVLLVEYSDRGGAVAVQVPAKSWMQTIQVQVAGGNPVGLEAVQLTDSWTVTNLEQIARWDADKIFLVVWYTLNPREVISSLKTDPRWSELRAVKNNELYAFPSDIYGWDSPEPRWILGMIWLAAKMPPHLFADIILEEEFYSFFEQMYGLDRVVFADHIMPAVQLDVH